MIEVGLSETQKVSLNILKQITKICDKMGLRYYLMYGTLIGAIRHNGFIPWDDDLDIMMPRDDHDKLINYLISNPEVIRHFEVYNYQVNNKYPYMITRIGDKRYWIDVENEDDYGIGVFIDIYPFDGLGNTKKEAIKNGLKGDRVSSLCYQATRQYFAIENTKSNIRKIIKRPVFFLSKMIGKDYFQNKLSSYINILPYDKSKYVGCVVWLSGGEKDIFLREWFNEFEYVKFEDDFFKVPKDYNQILTHIYGDYMTLPPLNERIAHHNYTTYKK